MTLLIIALLIDGRKFNPFTVYDYFRSVVIEGPAGNGNGKPAVRGAPQVDPVTN
jgi:hypothetical protein